MLSNLLLVNFQSNYAKENCDCSDLQVGHMVANQTNYSMHLWHTETGLDIGTHPFTQASSKTVGQVQIKDHSPGLASVVFIIIHLSGLLIIRGKKVKFRRILGTKSQKNRSISWEFSGQTWPEAIGKKRRILWLFSGQISQEIDRFCADQTSVFNVFLTEDIICSFNNK